MNVHKTPNGVPLLNVAGKFVKSYWNLMLGAKTQRHSNLFHMQCFDLLFLNYIQVVEFPRTYRISANKVWKIHWSTLSAPSDNCQHPCQTAAVLSKCMVYPSNCLCSAGCSTPREKKNPKTTHLFSWGARKNRGGWNNTEPAWKMDCMWERGKEKQEWRPRQSDELRSRQVFKQLQTLGLNCSNDTCEADL